MTFGDIIISIFLILAAGGTGLLLGMIEKEIHKINHSDN